MRASSFTRGQFTISMDAERLDVDATHAYLTRSYWAQGIPRELVQRSIENSLCFGLFHGARQVGFARIITDRATFAYLCDVYVLEDVRGQGLGKWLMEVALAHEELQGLRRWMLLTRDAHGLYARHGFTPLAMPASAMERARPDPYRGLDPAL